MSEAIFSSTQKDQQRFDHDLKRKLPPPFELRWKSELSRCNMQAFHPSCCLKSDWSDRKDGVTMVKLGRALVKLRSVRLATCSGAGSKNGATQIHYTEVLTGWRFLLPTEFLPQMKDICKKGASHGERNWNCFLNEQNLIGDMQWRNWK